MKLKSLFLLALAAVLTFAVPRSARALEVSFEFFQDSLSPYGEWIELGDYGYCWRPTGVDEDWAPYSDGYWTYTDAGWTWVSYEDFGGIVYHYGRWVNVEDEGWCWVPDYEWGPAWVSWRSSDDYVGWAPLPAEARWERERGFSVWVDSSYDIAPSHYNFCRFGDFGAPVLRPVLLRRSENVVIIHNTVNITNITYNTDAHCVFNGGLDYGHVNRFARRQIPALKLVRNNNFTVVNNHIVNNNVRVTNFNSVQRGNQLTVIAPTVVRPERARVAALLQPTLTKVIEPQKVKKGWGGVPADQRAAIRAKFQQESAGKTPETAPARPVKTADLKVVPVKADPKAKLPSTARTSPLVRTPGTDGAFEARKKAQEAITGAPTATPPAVATTPPVPTEPMKAGREKITGKKPAKVATPEPIVTREIKKLPPTEKIVTATPPPVVRERVAPTRPGIVKPFNPPVEDKKPTVRSIAPPPAPNPAIEKRNSAAEAAKQQAAAKDAARQRVLEQNNQQQEIVRRNNAQEAAAARQRMIQQQVPQKQPEPPVVRKRPVDPQPIQQNQVLQQQQQQINRGREMQAAEARQRSLQAQQSQVAARQQALENAKAQAAARQKAPSIQVQPPRNVPPPQVQPRQMPPRNLSPVQPQRVPAKPGKRPLTPEEAAQQQQLR